MFLMTDSIFVVVFQVRANYKSEKNQIINLVGKYT